MNRRGFLRAIGIGLGAIAGAPLLKYVVPAPVKSLSLRWVHQYDISSFPVQRMDVLYGVANLRPYLAARIEDQYDDKGKFIE